MPLLRVHWPVQSRASAETQQPEPRRQVHELVAGMGQLADSIDAAKGAGAKSGASTSVQTGAGALQNDQCAQKGQCR